MKKLLVAALLVPALAQAGGYSIPNTIPRDLAMGDALVAAQDSAAAAFRNPASLSRLSGLDLNLSPGILGNGTTWYPPASMAGTASVSTKFQAAYPVSAFLSWSGKIGDHGYGVGLGVNIPGGGNVYWPADWPGRYEIQTVDRKVYGGYLTLGFGIIPQIRVGGGVVYYYTTEKLSVAKALPGPGGTVDGQATLADSGGKVSWDASVDIQPVASYPLKIGIDYKQQAYQGLTGTVNLAFPPALQPLYPNQSITHTLPFPSLLNVGVSWNPIPAVEIDLAYTYEGYAAYQSDTFNGTSIDPSTGKPLSITVQRAYSNSSVFRLGAAWRVIPELEVRGGLLRDVSGVNPNYFNPSLPDGNVWGGSVGLGWDPVKNLTISGAFFYAWFDRLVSTPAADSFSSLAGAFDSYAWIASIGVQWRWDPFAKDDKAAKPN